MASHGHVQSLPELGDFTSGVTAKRVLDVVVAILALALLLPLMVVIAIAVRAETEGPAVFSQTRLGRGGRHFRLYKFRKFHEHAPAGGLAVTLRNDSRMTRVGRLLERTKLDELLQLWNVFEGDMSLVGPRPESLAFADCFAGPYRKVLDYTPGIFGPSQTIFRNESALYQAGCDPEDFYRRVLFPLKARLDLGYFPRASTRLDLWWIVRGAFVVLGRPAAPEERLSSVEELQVWIEQSFPLSA